MRLVAAALGMAALGLTGCTALHRNSCVTRLDSVAIQSWNWQAEVGIITSGEHAYLVRQR